jgi:glycosyltransferase involved in cell wall biosynthesis
MTRVGAGLRILMVTSDTYPPTRVDVTVLFGEELASRGHRIDLLLQSEAECASAYTAQWPGGEVFVGPTDTGELLLHRVRKHALGIWHDLKLFGLVRRGNYDIVIVKDKFVSGLWAALAVFARRQKFCYWLSWPYPEEYLTRARDGTARYPFLYRIRGMLFWVMLYQLLLRAASHVFVQSEQMRRDVAERGIPPSKITPVPMGIGAGAFGTSLDERAARSIPADMPSVLYLGTLSRVRRLDFLVRVMAHVLREMPAARLYVVGKGDVPGDEELLLAEARRLGVSHSIVMAGRLPQESALRYVLEADVCVSPFFPTPVLNSASPTKLVEYMAMGRAVVANDHPAQRQVIAESGAGICVEWDEGQFASAILELLRNPELRQDMGARGRAYVEATRSYGVIASVVERQLLAIARGQGEASP